MSERERWTVYPLLFLALGLAFKDKMLKQVDVNDVRCKKLVCNSLLVDDPSGNRVSIKQGRMQSLDVVTYAVRIPDQQGREMAQVSANAAGGFFRATGTENGITTVLGNTKEVAGLMFVDPQGTVHPTQLIVAPRKPEVPREDAGNATGENSAPEAEAAPAVEPPAGEPPAANEDALPAKP